MDDGFDPVSFLMGQRSIDPNAEYYTKAEVDVLLAQKNTLHYAIGTITTDATTTTISYSGRVINAYAKQEQHLVQCDITIFRDKVVFSLKDKPSIHVDCIVYYG